MAGAPARPTRAIRRGTPATPLGGNVLAVDAEARRVTIDLGEASGIAKGAEVEEVGPDSSSAPRRSEFPEALTGRAARPGGDAAGWNRQLFGLRMLTIPGAIANSSGMASRNVHDIVNDLLREKGGFRIGEFAAAMGVTRQAAHRHVRRLLAEERVVRVGAGRATRYAA